MGDKYPSRTFAVAGSSAEIAYPALRVFLKEKVLKKMGVLIPMEVLSRLHIIYGMIPMRSCWWRYASIWRFEERTIWGCVEGYCSRKDSNYQTFDYIIGKVISSETAVTVSRIDGASPEICEKAMNGVASMLVDGISAKDFLPVLQCMVEGPKNVFGASQFYFI